MDNNRKNTARICRLVEIQGVGEEFEIGAYQLIDIIIDIHCYDLCHVSHS